MMRELWHGTPGGYTNHQCRCDECRAAFREYQKERRRKRIAAETPDHVHGTANGYGNYGCRCEPCTTAWAFNERKVRKARRDRSGT